MRREEEGRRERRRKKRREEKEGKKENRQDPSQKRRENEKDNKRKEGRKIIIVVIIVFKKGENQTLSFSTLDLSLYPLSTLTYLSSPRPFLPAPFLLPLEKEEQKKQKEVSPSLPLALPQLPLPQLRL